MTVARRAFFLILLAPSFGYSQKLDSSRTVLQNKEPKVTMLAYMRVIRSASGDVRMDQNVVPNFRLNQWLRMECGLRFGQTQEQFNAYYGYKVELQSKSFYKTIRIIARLSDKIVRYPEPSSSRSNYLFAAEARFTFSPAFSGLAAAGYVFTYGKNNEVDFKPIVGVGTKNYPTFKAGLRYKPRKKNYMELVYGTYDVFNPYPTTNPFFQLVFDHDLSQRVAGYAYFRYQYDHYVDVPLNYFFTVGVRIQFIQRKN